MLQCAHSVFTILQTTFGKGSAVRCLGSTQQGQLAGMRNQSWALHICWVAHKEAAPQAYLLDTARVVDGNDLQEGVLAAGLQAAQEVTADTTETWGHRGSWQDSTGWANHASMQSSADS